MTRVYSLPGASCISLVPLAVQGSWGYNIKAAYLAITPRTSRCLVRAHVCTYYFQRSIFSA